MAGSRFSLPFSEDDEVDSREPFFLSFFLFSLVQVGGEREGLRGGALKKFSFLSPCFAPEDAEREEEEEEDGGSEMK